MMSKPNTDIEPCTIQYPYAVDESGVLTYINDVEKEVRHEHTYTCPNCGKPMVPRLGEHNAHCFAHDKGKTCGKESYIHNAAKHILARRFNEGESFIIAFATDRVCNIAKGCEHYDYYRCGFQERKEYDLKKYYDLPAEIEYTVSSNGSEYRPDVALLSSNNRRSPIFLEVFFKHKSTEDKIANNQCIEFHVKGFEDLHKLETEPIVESETIQFWNFKDRVVTPEQIESHTRNLPEVMDFKSCDCVLPFCKQSKDYKRMASNIRRFILYNSGKTFESGIFEVELNNHKPSALAELTYYSDRIRNFHPAYALAVKDKKFRTCNLCENCINCQDEVTWCKLRKNGSTRKGTFNTKKGAYCDSFEWGEWLFEIPYNKNMLEDNVEGRDYFIWIQDDSQIQSLYK